jgi:hypothetical protein
MRMFRSLLRAGRRAGCFNLSQSSSDPRRREQEIKVWFLTSNFEGQAQGCWIMSNRLGSKQFSPTLLRQRININNMLSIQHVSISRR